MNQKTPQDDHKGISTAIKQTKELMKNAGHGDMNDEAALLVMIYKEVRPQPVDRVGQRLAEIAGTLTAMLAGIQELVKSARK